MLTITLLFSRHRVPLKQALLLFVAGTSASFTGIFYYASLKTVPASIAIILLFQFVWVGIIIEAVATKTLPSREKNFGYSLTYRYILIKWFIKISR